MCRKFPKAVSPRGNYGSSILILRVPSCETYIGCDDDDDSCADFGIEASLRQATGTREGRNVNEEQTAYLLIVILLFVNRE